MVGAQIKTMLEEEIHASDEFARKNFGLSTGDDFREIVEETVKSQTVSACLLLDVLMVGLMAPKLSEWMKANTKIGVSASDQMPDAILNNLDAFKGPLEFLYWGIQIGRKLARQEAEALKGLETANSGQ